MLNKMSTLLLAITIAIFALPLAFSSPIEEKMLMANLLDAPAENATTNPPCMECLKTVIAGYEFMSQQGPKVVAHFLATCPKLGPKMEKGCIQFTTNNVQKFFANGMETTKDPIKVCQEVCLVV